jgi:serine/threonine protein phosphatase PrpC
MIVEICSETDPGLARRQNEDSIAFDAASGLCILADGMGGHNAGEVASGMATAFIKAELLDWMTKADKGINPVDLQDAMAESINKANGAIYHMSQANLQYAGMGTTLVVGVFCDNILMLAHIGDSRCYRLRDNNLLQLTKDHSFLQEQVDAGLVMADQTLPRIGQNLITRALGVADTVQADIVAHDILPHDIYLMCSDGLSDMVSDDAISAILLSTDPLEQKARQLIAVANDGGGRDNISVLLAQVDNSAKPGLLQSARRAIYGMWPRRD